MLPFWTSVLVRSYAWMVLLGRHGLINEALLAAGLIERPIRILNTTLATQIAMTHILLPYMILPIANALRQIDPSLLRAASGLGSPPWRTFLQVTLPLSMHVVGGLDRGRSRRAITREVEERRVRNRRHRAMLDALHLPCDGHCLHCR